MYSFVRGARLYVKGTREKDDPDNVPDPGDQIAPDDSMLPAVSSQTRTQMASASQESREVFRTSHVRSGLKTVHTSRVIRKTTTLTRGEQTTLEREERLAIEPTTRSVTTQHRTVRHSEHGTQTKVPPKTRTSSSMTDTKKVVRKIEDSTTRKKQKISDITFSQNNESLTAREALLRWAQRTTDRYPGVKVRDFTQSWRDGLAFNAIIHRSRPDLIDFRSLRNRTARDNLENAFHVAERDFGVTRLLDPEDVDTPEPDEKSLITYISSLYDVFPEPPSHHPFGDDEKLRKVDDYRDIANRLYIWLRESIQMLQSRSFPSTLVEVKALLTECTRFRVEEIPSKQQDKQKLSHLWRDVQRLVKENRLTIDDELRYDSLEQSWNRMISAHAERDRALHDEVARLERLQRLAEKVHRETKQCDGKLDDIERKIAEEEKRLQRLHPMDAKHNCDQIEHELKQAEDSIKSMFKDVETLFEGKYHKAPELRRQVQNLHQRWSNIRLNFQSRLLNALSSTSYKVEERKVTKQRQVISEHRLVETNEYFKFLQDCIDWVNEKLKYLEEADYGSDLPSVQSLLEKHQTEHRLIDQFYKNVSLCVNRLNLFKGDEQELYRKLLTKLERGYSEVLVLSNKRMSDLETLLDFIQSATNELMWLNQKEETEISRDWSAKNLNLVEVEQYHEILTSEMERREVQFNAVHDRGTALGTQNHPASKCIEAYLSAMQTQWSWLLQLIVCLETHLKHASAYHQFFKESRECEQWLQRIEERLTTTYSRHSFSIDEGERLLKQMQELREDLARYASIVNSLIDRSKDIYPLKQRRQPLPRPLRVTAVCNYNQLNMTVNKNEQCWLHDNSQLVRWKIINSKGVEGMVPGVCFVIPPPNPEAIDLAESLKRKYDLVVKLWTKKQHKLRLNMIFATIKIVKSWDLKTFRSMEPNQRESIIRALNEDADKLLEEGDKNDPDMKRLQEEIKYCNKLFQDLLAKLREEEAEQSPKSPTRRFNDISTNLESILKEKERTLTSRVQAPIPRDLDTLDSLVVQHKGFETELQALEPQVAEMKVVFKQVTKKIQVMQNRYEIVVDTWDRLWSVSHLYVERLKAVEIAVNTLNESTQIVSNVEIQLASYDNLPNDQDALRKTHESLMTLQLEMQQHQQTIEQLGDDVNNVRHITEKSRSNVYNHPDVRKLDDDAKKVIKRWNNCCNQVVERLRSCEAASELLRAYRNKMDDERVWASQMTVKVNSIKVVKSAKDAEKEYQLALSAMQEKYRMCDDSISNLMSWIGEVEIRLANLGNVYEDVDGLRHQINSAKTIREELEINQKLVVSCLDQVHQIVQHGQELLSKEEIDTLQKQGNTLRTRYDNCNDHCSKLLRRLTTALEELHKFTSEIQNFKEWLNGAQKTLAMQEKSLGDIGNLRDNAEQYRAFSSDVIAHQADLRFITMAAQKFVDESKEYLRTLNDLRTNLPRRLAHIEPTDSEVKAQVAAITTSYQNLLNRVNRLSDRFSGLGDRKRQYADSVEKATLWLNDAQRSAKKLLEEPVAAEPKAIQDQLDRVKAFNLDVISQSRLIETAKHSARSLLESLEGTDISNAERQSIEDTVQNLDQVYHQLVTLITEKSNELQTALVHSQDIQDGLDRILKWLDDAESTIRNQSKPVSLLRDRLDEQIHEHRVLQSDIDSQRPSIDALNASARDLLNSSNPRLAKKVESKLKDLNTRFEKLVEKSRKRGELLDEVSGCLDSFNGLVARYEEWFATIIESVEAHDATSEEFASRIERAMNQRNAKKDDFEDLIRTGKNLVGKRDVADTSHVKDKLRSLEQQWKELGDLLADKQRQGKARAEQLSAYENLRSKVLEWLSHMEMKVESLESVSVDREILRKQALEIKPLVKEHADYSSTIDKVNDLGKAYDSLLKGESPRRRITSPTKKSTSSAPVAPSSPTRRSPPKLRQSPDGVPGKTSIQSPLSSASSGFSSRHSSADHLGGLEDLSPVQQQLSEINHRYHLLGVKLNDRQQEIDSLSDEVKKHLETLKILSAFVQTKERSLPRDALPASKELAEKQLAVVKEIQEEVIEKQSDMDRLKTQVHDLLRQKPNVSGADTLQQQLTELLMKWTELQSAIKERLTLLQDFKDFQDTQELLFNWLNQKDKMFQVLGPIAHEPRMVTAQMQQVQVMRDELTSQEPLLRRMIQSGKAITERLDATNPTSRKIREQTDSIRRRWEELVNRLEEREHSLDAASGATTDFHSVLNRLQDSLQNISDDFDKVTESGTDTDDQLRKLSSIEDQLENQRPLLTEAESMCEHLCDILSDSASKSEIKSKFCGTERLYNNLVRKLNNRKAELESSMREDKEFIVACDNIQHWLRDIQNTLSPDFRVSADSDILQRQVAEYEPCYKEVLDREHEVHMLFSKGSDMVNKISRKQEAQQLKIKLDTIRKQWDKIKKDATDRHTRLQRCSENCKKFHGAFGRFAPWLHNTEDKFSDLRPISFHRPEIEKQIREIQGFKHELSKHSQEYDNVRTLGETLLASCDTDKEGVKRDLDTIKNRWDKLSQGVQERALDLEGVSQRLGEFQEKSRDLGHSLQRMEDKVSSHDALSDSAKDRKLLERMKSLLHEAEDLQRNLDRLKVFAETLISSASPHTDTSHITDEVDSLEKRHQALTRKLEDCCTDLESASNVLDHYNAKVKAAHHDLNSLEEELDGMGPVARDIRTLNGQMEDVKNFKSKLAKTEDEIEDAERECKDIISHGYTPDAKGAKAQLDSLKRQLNRLEDRAKSRESSLEGMLAKLERFYEDLHDVQRNLNDAAAEEKAFRPVGGDVETIRAQQDEFKSFRRSYIEPLGKEIDEINRVGQGLVQSASPGVSTTNLERDLEKLNDDWNHLKEKMSERERRLDVALLQSGKFQEALAGVEKWLQDTEEMVANQKPPSADYKVVKAQLQEQKFLNKLLLDRQTSMSSLMTMGEEVMKNVESIERSQIEAQLKDIMYRFEKLNNGAHKRMDALERTIPVAKAFQEKMAPLVEWLEQTEKRLATMATIPTDRDRIAKRIAEHQSLHSDILVHKRSFEELTEIAQMLMGLVGDDEAQAVVEQLQEVTDRYAKLVEDSEHIDQLLAEARLGMNAFVVNFEDILVWIEEMESRLSRYQILSVYVEKLQEQCDELTELSEEIADHHKQVDDIIGSGQDIMKHASGDDAIQLKDRLDMLQSKFTELTHRAADRLRQAQEALPIAHNFHSSLERLVLWMDEAEAVLKSVETVGLSSQETTIQRLESDIQEFRGVLEVVNHLGPQLCQMSPGEGAAVIESMVSRVNRRFDTICEQIQRKAERIELSKQRNVEVIGDIDDLLEWFREMEKQVLEAEPIVPDPDALASMLKEQKALSEEVSSQKGRVRDILSAAKKLMRESSTEDQAMIRNKAEDLKALTNNVSALCADRLSALEQALPLAEHFFETHADLVQWLDEVEGEAEILGAPSLHAVQIKRQQEKNKALLQSVNEHKPLLDKLNKTGAALIRLCSDGEAAKVQYIINSDNSRYNSLKNLLREQQNALEEALQSTSQFADKLDGMLNALASTADQLNNAEPISAHPERIQEQISDNKAVVSDLSKRSSALEAVKKAAKDVITKAGGIEEPAVRDIKKKLDRLNDLWGAIQKAANSRGKSLENALTVAEKFWDELNAVMRALKDLQDNLNAQEPPAVEPNAIQQQQDVLQEIKQEMEQTKPEVDQCRQAGQDLMQLCGEPDKPEVKKHIEDLDSAWENVTTLYAKREQNLIDAMEKAMGFHDTLQNLLEFLDTAEETFAHLGPVASDIEAVKNQISQLKNFKNEVDPHMIEVESLNRQAQELMERTSPDQALSIREPMKVINKRWNALLKGIVDRQRELENALLRLGQFQHALDELLVWMSKTEKTLDDMKPIVGDPQVIEVELAKHKVLMNDIQAHQTSVDTLNKAGHQLIEADRHSEDASVTQGKLNNLNNKWQKLQNKAAERQKRLEAALKEAQAFNQEIQDLLMWLSDIDGQLVSSKPVGGLPETAREQLNRFMELYNELDSNRHKVESVLQQGHDYLSKSNEGAATNMQHNLKTLKQRWENVLNRANDRKIKLEIALREATEFHESLQEFVEWLTSAEKYLTNLKPVSRVMESVLQQIEDHKNFQKDVGAHREVMLNLDKKGTHLKYFSQKQDVILIKNLLISVQHRWERVVSKAAERTRALDHGYKEAKEFHDSWSDLNSWLIDADNTLNSLTHIGNDPEKIKQLLAKHKEFQRTLGSKQPVYDSTMRAGRSLKDKCSKADVPTLQNMMDELKNKWNAVCNKSVDRQRKLEEALLFSGQFKDAVEALIDWLDKSLGSLNKDQPVHGDLDTVNNLVEQHKNFQEELKSRANNLDSVRRTANELLLTASSEDAANIRSQMSTLESKWQKVVSLSDDKQKRLEDALKQAEQLHKAVHMLLEWLSDAEMKLRFAGPLPEDEETTRLQIAEHQRLMQEMAEQEGNKDRTIALAQEILRKCHPDAVSVIRHWITIIQSRWEEVSVWAKQREQRLMDHLRSLRDILDLLEELMRWLLGAEATLTALEAEPLPDDIPTLEKLIEDHKVFMDDMSKRQPDVERVTKAFSSKRQPQQQQQAPGREKGKHDAHDRRTPRGTSQSTPRTSTPVRGHHVEPEIKHPRARELVEKWQHVWLLALERQRRLQDKYKYLLELERIKNFDFDEWRKRFLGWMNNKKSRVMDLFRKIDKDNDGKVTREDFIDGILKSKFPTSRLEMERVAEIFDRNGDGFVDHKEYIDTLRPDRDNKPLTEAEKIQDEVQRQVAQCTCVHRFKVYQVGEGKYRFGESQKLRLVRILRSTVMVRVGGGWVALDEFLVKNDPCRAKGRTNLELREQFILAEGVSQSLTPFKPKPSPNSSQSSQSGAGSFVRSAGSFPATGPITKVKEKTERSVPISRQKGYGGADNTSDFSGPSLSETDSMSSRSLSRPRTANRLTPGGTGSKPSSRPSSRPPSRPSSRPPSRAGSDLSTESVEGYRASRGAKTPSGRQRTPSGSSQTSTGPRGTPTSPTKIPTVRRTPSGRKTGDSTDGPVRERWK